MNLSLYPKYKLGVEIKTNSLTPCLIELSIKFFCVLTLAISNSNLFPQGDDKAAVFTTKSMFTNKLSTNAGFSRFPNTYLTLSCVIVCVGFNVLPVAIMLLTAESLTKTSKVRHPKKPVAPVTNTFISIIYKVLYLYQLLLNLCQTALNLYTVS